MGNTKEPKAGRLRVGALEVRVEEVAPGYYTVRTPGAVSVMADDFPQTRHVRDGFRRGGETSVYTTRRGDIRRMIYGR